MNKARLLLLLSIFLCGWLIYRYYGQETVDSVIDDVQAYQSRSLLPEDN